MPGVRVEGDRIISDPPARLAESRLTGRGSQARQSAESPRPGDGTRRDGRPLRGRGHEPLQFPRLRLLVAGDHPVRPQPVWAAGERGFAATDGKALRRRRANRPNRRVLDRHGQTDDGKVWLRYRLSKAASTYAVITVPAALEESGARPLSTLGPRRPRDRHLGHQGRPRLGAGRLSPQARRPHRRPHHPDARSGETHGRGVVGREGKGKRGKGERTGARFSLRIEV